MSVVARIDRFQRRHGWAGLPLAVLYKFFDDQGPYLVALLTYYALLSLFPLLLLLVSALGFALHGNEQLQQQVLHSALSQFPVIGDQIGRNIHSLRGNGFALAVGVAGSLYGALGVVQAAQTALNRIWAVPRHARPNPILSRLRSLALLAVLGGGFLLSALVTVLGADVNARGTFTGATVRVVTVAVSIGLNALLLVLVLRMLTARAVPLRHLGREAAAAAVVWQLLQAVGAYYVNHRLRGAGATYGLFGIVLGLVAWLYLGALTFVLCAETSAVRARRLWPRSLLTPFTDRVFLTRADRRAYESYAATEAHKGFEEVDVEFHQAPPEAPGGLGADRGSGRPSRRRPPGGRRPGS